MIRGWFIAAAALLTLCSCISTQQTEMEAINSRGWSEPCDILIENGDTLSMRTIGVALRYNHDFKADTLALRIGVLTPDIKHFEERVTLQLSRPYTASAVAASETLPYRVHSVLAQKGTYIFTITPEYAVEGIEAVGITIENE